MAGEAGRVAAERAGLRLRRIPDAPVTEPGAMAGWIAPPKRGIHGWMLDSRYVEFR